MTLLELMIGLVIVALVVTAGYAAFGAVIDRRAQMREALDPVIRAATLRNTLMTWLRLGTPLLASGGAPLNDLTLGGAGVNSELRFHTTAPTPFHPMGGTPGVTITLYVNVTDPRTPRGLVALLTPVTGQAIADSLRVPLDAEITGMLVEYLTSGPNGRRWMTADELVSGGAEQGAQPVAIRLTLLTADPVREQPLLRLPIVAPMQRGL